MNEERKIALQAQTSVLEKGDGLGMGSAGIILVFTIFLTASAVYPATQSEANQPPTAENNNMVRLYYPESISILLRETIFPRKSHLLFFPTCF